MSCGYIFNLELVNTFICTPNFSQHLVVHSDMKFSHLLNAKFYSEYRIDILFIIQTCLKSQKICCVLRSCCLCCTRFTWIITGVVFLVYRCCGVLPQPLDCICDISNVLDVTALASTWRYDLVSQSSRCCKDSRRGVSK